MGFAFSDVAMKTCIRHDVTDTTTRRVRWCAL